MTLSAPVLEAQNIINAERFQLRPIRNSDMGLIEMHCGDKRVAENVRDIPHPLPPGATSAMITSSSDPKREEDIWVIDGMNFGHAEVMGMVYMKRLDRMQSEIRYWVAPAFWNSGIATMAVDAVLQANPQGATQIFAEVFQDNPWSARVLTNAGFDYLGDAETYCVARGAVVPTWTYMRKMET